jgi:hypothetical protein
MIRKAIVAALVLLAGCSGDKLKDPASPDGYGLVLPVTPAQGGTIQRVALPPAAIGALTRADHGDYRLFDGSGRKLAVALDSSRADAANAVDNAVPVTPIEMPRSGGPGNVSVQIGQGAQDVTVDVNARPDREGRPLAGLLLDTRELVDPAREVRLVIELPRDRLVEITVEQSSDLKTWTRIASRQLVRFPGEDLTDVVSAVPLGGAMLKDTYLRISYPVASDVLVRTARVVTMKAAAAPQIAFATTGAALIDPHTIAFRYPLGGAGEGSAKVVLDTGSSSLAPRLRITGSDQDGVIPLRLEGRRNAESPWTGWDGATLRGGQAVELRFPGAAMADYRVVADPDSAGFFALPRIELLVDPVDLLVSFGGSPPYRLAVGNPAATPSLLADRELLGPNPPAAIPTASVAGAKEAPVLSIAPAGDGGPFSPRKLALWAALLLAVGVLAFAAVRLMTASAKEPAG